MHQTLSLEMLAAGLLVELAELVVMGAQSNLDLVFLEVLLGQDSLVTETLMDSLHLLSHFLMAGLGVLGVLQLEALAAEAAGALIMLQEAEGGTLAVELEDCRHAHVMIWEMEEEEDLSQVYHLLTLHKSDNLMDHS
jgi:hypothetical protein